MRKFQINPGNLTLLPTSTVATSNHYVVENPAVVVDQYKNLVVIWSENTAYLVYLAYFPSEGAVQNFQIPNTISSDPGEVPGLYINRSQVEKGVAVWANLVNTNVYSQPFFIYNPGVGLIYQLNQGPVHYQ